MEIKNLKGVETQKIVAVFNEAFSDYTVPMQLTTAQLTNRMVRDRVDLEFSFGIFENDRLLAFMLHGIENRNDAIFLYNAATGVIPSERGKSLSRKLYESIISQFRTIQAKKITLEVISSNIPAISSYKQVGFEVSRRLLCFKGRISDHERPTLGRIKIMEQLDWPKLHAFWDWEPSWQQSIAAVQRSSGSTIGLGYYIGGKLVGYLIYEQLSRRVVQFAVASDFRGRGIGTSLFKYLAVHYNQELSVLNIDDTATDSIAFLQSLGLVEFIWQLEMELLLDHFY